MPSIAEKSTDRVAAAANIALGVVIVMLFLAVGALSNWFRYGVSLEALFALIPLVAGGAVALILLSLARVKRSTGRLVAGVIVFAFSVIMFMVAHRQAFGITLPRLHANHVVTSGTATLQTEHSTLSYHLDLHNPFASSHRELLIIESVGKTREFELPVFEEGVAVGGYVGPARPDDWVTLRPTGRPGAFEVLIGPGLLVEKRFQINLESK
jgi:hypothetical protein